VETLRLEQVVKKFGSLTVCNGIDLTAEKGELVCLVGASGAGKSTLLRCINLLEPIDEGAIYLDGQDISAPGLDPQPIRAKVGIVFQSFNLFPHMNAISNVMLAPRRVYKKSRRELQQPVERLFVRFGLQDQMYKYPDQLSGGQQQRVAIVRALAMDPQVMLFDEITSALDPQLVGEVLDVLLKLKQDGMTILMATHEINFARKAANKICFLKDGRVLEEGSPEQLFTAPKQPETAAFLGAF
jgi:polar amino acid transport system ATP-binding protein